MAAPPLAEDLAGRAAHASSGPAGSSRWCGARPAAWGGGTEEERVDVLQRAKKQQQPKSTATAQQCILKGPISISPRGFCSSAVHCVVKRGHPAGRTLQQQPSARHRPAPFRMLMESWLPPATPQQRGAEQGGPSVELACPACRFGAVGVGAGSEQHGDHLELAGSRADLGDRCVA